MSRRVISHRPSFSSLSSSHNTPSSTRSTKSPTPKQSTVGHRTTSQRGRSRHQNSPSSSIPPTPDSSSAKDIEVDPMESTDQDKHQGFPLSPTPKNGRNPRRGSNLRKSVQKRNAGSEQRLNVVSTDGEPSESDNFSGDDDALFDLLGVSSPGTEIDGQRDQVADDGENSSSTPRPTRGVLAVSKADIEGRRSPRSSGRKSKVAGPRSEESPHQPEDSDQLAPPMPSLQSGSNALPKSEGKKKTNRNGKGKDRGDQTVQAPAHTKDAAISGLSATRPKANKQTSSKQVKQVQPKGSENNNQDAFETSSLSQSLPSGGIFASMHNSKGKSKQKGKKAEEGKDDSLVWEMPEASGPLASQALTWQQKLQGAGSSESPRRSAKSTPALNTVQHDRNTRSRNNKANINLPPPSAMANSTLAGNTSSRPAHSRRLSLDNLPVSAFDDTLPFHTGMNVNRAPQTPAKLPTSKAPGAVLPLLAGEFPRIGKSSHGPFSLPAAQAQGGGGGMGTPMGIKYAGPTFHNSPHAASLPKPDLDDF